MCVMLDFPPSIEAQVPDYERTMGKPIQQILLEYLQKDMQRAREGRARVMRFRKVLSLQRKLTGEPYTFHRQDAYEEALG